MGVAFMLAGPLAAWAACDPSQQCCASLPGTGSPCGGSGPATTGNTSRTVQSAGNPINVLTGNKYLREVDMPALPGVLGLEIIRHYNSGSSGLNSVNGILGRGWKLSYETELQARGGTLEILQSDGTRLLFSRSLGNPALYVGRSPEQGRVFARRSAAGTEYSWVWQDGRRLDFDANARLVQIAAPTGEFLSLQYDPKGWLVRVTDPQGRQLELNYLDRQSARSEEPRFRGVASIDSPLGRFGYEYGVAPLKGSQASALQLAASLVKVSLPTHVDAAHKTHAWSNRNVSSSSVSRLYHYEDAKNPSLITGITVNGQGSDGQQMVQRVSTWAYDAHGRAVLSVKGEPLSASAGGQSADAVKAGAPLQSGQAASSPAADEKLPAQAKGKPFASPGKAPSLTAPTQGLQQVTLQWPQDGRTLLTNSLGQQTVYKTALVAGEQRILEVTGPGCATCGPSNMRYGYDALGRLTEETQLSAGGQPLSTQRTELDGYGRPRRISHIDYLNGKAQAPRWTQRFEYAAANEKAAQTDPSARIASEPVLIARPSVVPGKEHQVRIRYNDIGQPLEVTESGFSPLDEAGQPSRTGTPIQRSVRYTYQRINGRSVLAQIDGPLPNGPKADPSDSDIVRLDYDAQGNHIIRKTEPAQLLTELVHDDAGRIIQSTTSDGFRRVQTQTVFAGQASIALQVESTTTTAWLLDAKGQTLADSRLSQPGERRQYNAKGELTLSTDAAGRETRYRYDTAGHPISMADGQDNASRLSLDTEGRPMVAALYRAGQSQPHRASYFWRDELGRMTQRLLPDGRIDSWSYARPGPREANRHLDGDGVLRLAVRDREGRGEARITQSPDGWLQAMVSRLAAPSERGSELRPVQIDDFGRKLRLALPDHGVQWMRYDEDDSLLLLTRADGTATRYRYDGAGRLLEKRYEDAQSKLLARSELSHHGELLAAAKDEEQESVFSYDSLGRLRSETIRLKGMSKEFRTETGYAADGMVSTRTLADGRVLRMQRKNAREGGSVERLTLQSASVSALHEWLLNHLPDGMGKAMADCLPGELVVSELQIDAFNGLSRYRFGNGIQTERTFDIAGRLTELKTDLLDARRYGYEVGPRIRSIETLAANASSASQKASFRYQVFSASLVSAEKKTSAAASTARAAETPSRNNIGLITRDTRHRYTYTPSGQLATVHLLDGRLLATYAYNGRQQRVRKTVHAPDGIKTTTFFLWQDGVLAGEIDAQGQLQHQYLYLDEGEHALPLAQLSPEETLYIHTDHRASPVAMTDRSKAKVWTAPPSNEWGARLKTETASSFNPSKAQLRLRLPGQYFDEETGLHDNWHRSYDPDAGRYLQPDPLGYLTGGAPYLYANGDPINYVDPKGLYQIDMHYYMVLFLGLAAGLDDATARHIALASQYIDDNPVTRPVEVNAQGKVDIYASVTTNQERLKYYHFMKDTLETGDSSIHTIQSGNQLNNLNNAYLNSPDCAKEVFYGEMLHALADTWSHADASNKPYHGVNLIGLGIGHGLNDSDPDYTFNHWGYPALINLVLPDAQPNENVLGSVHWEVNADRTLQAEEAIFDMFSSQNTFAKRSDAVNVSFEQIEELLTNFNSTGESEQYSFTWDGNGRQNRVKHEETNHSDRSSINRDFSKKLEILNQGLQNLGLNIDLTSEQFAYDEGQAATQRNDSLYNLECADYPGVILPRQVCSMPRAN